MNATQDTTDTEYASSRIAEAVSDVIFNSLGNYVNPARIQFCIQEVLEDEFTISIRSD